MRSNAQYPSYAYGAMWTLNLRVQVSAEDTLIPSHTVHWPYDWEMLIGAGVLISIVNCGWFQFSFSFILQGNKDLVQYNFTVHFDQVLYMFIESSVWLAVSLSRVAACCASTICMHGVTAKTNPCLHVCCCSSENQDMAQVWGFSAVNRSLGLMSGLFKTGKNSSY